MGAASARDCASRAVEFFEAIIFPIPPEVMLAPMCLAQPKRGWYFATVSLQSMVGMFVAYAIGYYAIELVMPLLERLGYAVFEDVKRQAAENGFWLLLIAGFTPVPFKIFTLASGAVGMPMPLLLRCHDWSRQTGLFGCGCHSSKAGHVPRQCCIDMQNVSDGWQWVR